MASDKYLRALGEVTAEASGLEWCIAYFLMKARGAGDEYLSAVLTRVGGARWELEKFRDDVEAAHQHKCPTVRGVEDLAARMSRALSERNRLVHAVEIVQLSKWGGKLESTRLHYRTGSVHATADELYRLADKIRGIGGTALRMTVDIERWRTSHSGFD
jgi:hypothetical protein